MEDSSWHSAQLKGSATYCQADNCNIGHTDILAGKHNQQLLVLITQQGGPVLVEPGAASVKSLVAWQESIQTELVHLTQADTLALFAYDHQLARFRQADLNKLESVSEPLISPLCSNCCVSVARPACNISKGC